jgi:hypothetical protein
MTGSEQKLLVALVKMVTVRAFAKLSQFVTYLIDKVLM